MKTSEFDSGQKLVCPQCDLSCNKVSELGRHQMTYHHDTWAVIDLLEGGVSDQEALQLYEKCTKNRENKFGRGRKRALVDDSPIIEDPEKNRQISKFFSKLGALNSYAQMFVTKIEPKVEFEDQESCVKMEEQMNGSWIVNEDVFHNNITDEAADTGISDNNHDNQKLMDAADTFELPAKDNEVCKETDSLRGQVFSNQDVNNSEIKPDFPSQFSSKLSPKPKDEVEIIENNATYQKTLAAEIFDASVQTFVDSNEKEIQRLAREIDEMLEQEMAGLDGSRGL